SRPPTRGLRELLRRSRRRTNPQRASGKRADDRGCDSWVVPWPQWRARRLTTDHRMRPTRYAPIVEGSVFLFCFELRIPTCLNRFVRVSAKRSVHMTETTRTPCSRYRAQPERECFSRVAQRAVTSHASLRVRVADSGEKQNWPSARSKSLAQGPLDRV